MEERQALMAFGALSQETRLRLLKMLVVAGDDGLAAGALAELADVSASNVSFHLKELERAGLITSQRDARSIIYRAYYDGVRDLLNFLMEDCCSGRPEICAPLAQAQLCCAPSQLIAESVDAKADDFRAALTASRLPTDDLGEDDRSYWRFRDASRTVAFGGYELHEGNALLRSIVVLPEVRGCGIGRQAVAQLMEKASGKGANAAYLLTSDAGPFFERLGFEKMERKDAPPAILVTRQAASICPESATLMMMRDL